MLSHKWEPILTMEIALNVLFSLHVLKMWVFPIVSEKQDGTFFAQTY